MSSLLDKQNYKDVNDFNRAVARVYSLN